MATTYTFRGIKLSYVGDTTVAFNETIATLWMQDGVAPVLTYSFVGPPVTDDFSEIDPMNITWVDTEYSKAYLRHLFTVNEMLGRQIATIHNLGFYLWLVREARKHILAGDFNSWKKMMVQQMDKRL
mgnify:CR=1 FL=1